MRCLLFGYGSLIATPEYPSRVIARHPAVLHGHRREFNKRSPGRGCPREQAYAPFDDVPAEYLTGDWAFSLAVGTRLSPDEQICGVALEYHDYDRGAVLQATDAREGYDPDGERATLGYLREIVSLESTDGPLEAVTYLSNPGGRYDLPPDTALDVRARILINGTPRPDTPVGRAPKVRGIAYLEQLRTELYALDWVDPLLEAQAAAILAYDGPWTEQVAAPRPRQTPTSISD